MTTSAQIETFISDWAITGGSELANTQSFVSGLAALIGVAPPNGSQSDDAKNDYVFERRVFQDNGDGTKSFGRLDAYKQNCFVLEAKQGTDADRAAAIKGESDFFGKPIAEKLKQGTAKRGTAGWAAAMLKAKGQAERYAKALSLTHGWPPFLLITDVGHCIDVYADFSGTGKQYTQFPDAARFRITLEGLRDEKVRNRLASIWTNPLSLDPSKEAAQVTREIAGHLAELSKRLEKRGNNPTRVADFLMRCLFTMFAEDVGLIPKTSFTLLLKKMVGRPENLTPVLNDLWKKMDTGGFVGALGNAGETVLKFNGYLFKDQSVIALEVEEIVLLIAAAEKKWNHVEPAIFGTLLERALDGRERAKLGAHYTPRAYVERLVIPTVIEPLRADWLGVQAAVTSLIESGKAAEARAVVEKFHSQLAQTKVLDPACGTGNFLYVAMARLKELEGEVVSLLIELGDNQYVAELSGHTITPENFLGIEINPRAAAIAQLVLWIGYLQWHFRVNGEDRMPPEPVLRDVKTIENRDALITWDRKVLERDENGKPLTRWDGETMKTHPVTRAEVPNEAAQVEVYRFVNPKPTKWPKTDYIIGNPPFHGARTVRASGVHGYIEAVRQANSDVAENADFVMYWWHKAAQLTSAGKLNKFGFITTKSITQSFSRAVMETHLIKKDGISIAFAIPNHPWIDEADGAAVRVAFTVGSRGKRPGVRMSVTSETPIEDGAFAVEFEESSGVLSAGLLSEINLQEAVALKASAGISSVGFQLTGQGFIVDSDLSARLSDSERDGFVFGLLGAREIVQKPRGRKVIDVCGVESESELRRVAPNIYQHLLVSVKPERDVNARKSVREKWWIYGEARNTFRPALARISNQIVTPLTAKHRIFTGLPIDVRADSTCVCIALEGGYALGILSSHIHVAWALANGGRLGVGDDPRYLKGECFDSFPFPEDVSDILKEEIRAEADALDALRKKVLCDHDELTLTGIYNVLEALRSGRPLSDQERNVHDLGLVSLIRQHHDAINLAVSSAYCWPRELSNKDILARLLALNKQRASEETKGKIRWLRPEFQAPAGMVTPSNDTLDLGDAPVGPSMSGIPWPKTLVEQVSAVASILAAQTVPQNARDIAAFFDGKRAPSIAPMLDALASIGQARRLKGGKYAA